MEDSKNVFPSFPFEEDKRKAEAVVKRIDLIGKQSAEGLREMKQHGLFILADRVE